MVCRLFRTVSTLNMLLLMNMLVASGLEPFWMHRTYISPNLSMRLLEHSAEKCLQESVALMCMASRLDRFLIMSVRGPNLCMASFLTAVAHGRPADLRRPTQRTDERAVEVVPLLDLPLLPVDQDAREQDRKEDRRGDERHREARAVS